MAATYIFDVFPARTASAPSAAATGAIYVYERRTSSGVGRERAIRAVPAAATSPKWGCGDLRGTA
jgi:hypothetical protein